MTTTAPTPEMTPVSATPVPEAIAPTPEMTLVPAPAEVILPPKPAPRLVSLDALRGFDMFWIIGAENVVMAVCELTDPEKFPLVAKWGTKHFPHYYPKAVNIAAVVKDQMDHVPWRGIHFYDMIFPTFVFIVGVSLVFSLSKAVERGGKAKAIRRVIYRGLVLYCFGLLYYGGVSHSFGGIYHQHNFPPPAETTNAFARVITDIRFMGVLQRIAICYAITGLLFCLFRPRVLIWISAGLLLVYWFLLVAVHPGQQQHSYDENKNLTNWIDAHYLPGYKWDGDHDPEGILSTIPAVGGCLLGVFAGLLLRNPNAGGYQKAGILVLGGAIFIFIGMVWGGIPLSIHDGGWTLPESVQFPIIKKLWTSSFVMLTAGCASVVLGLFYLVIDVWKQRWIAAPFVWIGMNAITLYLLWEIISFQKLAARFVGGEGSELSSHLPSWIVEVATPLLALIFIFLVARFLYKRQIFLRV